jgi:hypothetical protein
VNDGAKNSSSIYENAVRGIGFDAVVLNTERINITDRLLEDFRVVVWFTGDSNATLSGNERDVLTNFVSEGGNLFLSGNNIGEDISNNPFFSEVLHARFVRKSHGFGNLAGTPNDQIGRGLLLDIKKSGEEISPLDGTATPVFSYIGDGVSALRINASEGRIVFMSLGFENIIGISDSSIVIKRIFDYFNIDDQPPLVINLTPENGKHLEINTSNVTINLITNEHSQCRISDSFGLRFRDSSLFDITNGTIHSTFVTGLQNGEFLERFINCRDKARNVLSFAYRIFVNNRTFLAPEIQPIGSQFVDENKTLNILINASDPEDDPINFTLEDILAINFPKPIASRFIVKNNSLTINTGFNDSGEYKLRLTAFDGFSRSDTEFKLTINNVNRKPLLGNIPQLNAVEDSFFNITLEAFDPDNDPITFSDNTSLFNINIFTGAIAFTPRKPDVGMHNATITVTDGELADMKTAHIIVAPSNHPPTLEFISPQFATRGILFSLQIGFSDPENDTLQFFDNTTLFNISSTGLINFTPAGADVGTHFITITASDGILNSSKLLNLIVQSENRAPIIKNITTHVIALQNQSVNLSIIACDPDLDPGCE